MFHCCICFHLLLIHVTPPPLCLLPLPVPAPACLLLTWSAAAGGDLQASSAPAEEGGTEDLGWEEEKELERLACEGDDFIPPKIMVSKVPFPWCPAVASRPQGG